MAVLSRQQQPNDSFYRSELSFPGQKSNSCSMKASSRWPSQWPQWPFYQPEAATWPDHRIWSTDYIFYHFPCKEFINGRAAQIFGTMAALSKPLAKPVAAMAVLSTRSGQRPDLWISSTDGKFYHFPCKEFINGRAIRKLEFREEIKGNLVDPASNRMLVSKTK